MTALEGTRALVRFNLRRDRIVLPVCIAAIVGIVFIGVSSLSDLYPTVADRQHLARTLGDNPAVAAIRGQPRNLDTLAGLITYHVGVIYSTVVALMSILLVGRHTRGDEEAGRTELVLAGVAGRRAPIAAALIVVGAADLLIGAGVALALIAHGLALGGSVALGAWFAAVGLVFAGVAALTAQLSESRRTATGMALAALGVAYGVRMAGDSADGTLTWLSPIGWAEELRPFDGERWWPLMLLAAATVLAVGMALRLLSRRDLGAGLVPQRPGRAVAGPGLLSPLGLALRLQRVSLVGWSTALFLFGLVYGSITNSVDDLVQGNDEVRKILAQAGGVNLVDSFLASTLLYLALIATGFAVQSALRPRGEETADRVEMLLATATSRLRWAGSHLTVAALGAVLLMVLGGLGAGLGAAISTGDAGEVLRLTGGALTRVPACGSSSG